MGDYEYETDSGCLYRLSFIRDPEEGEDEAGGPTLAAYQGAKEVSSRKVMNCPSGVYRNLVPSPGGCGSCTGETDFDAQVQLDDQANIVRIIPLFGIVVALFARLPPPHFRVP